MNGDCLALGAVGLLALAGAAQSRGTRNVGQPDWPRINRALSLLPVLRARWAYWVWGQVVEDQDELDDFFLAEVAGMPGHLQRWWKGETGMTYIGQGATRLVFRMGDGNVLKLALDFNGEQANISEIEVWDEWSEDENTVDFLVPLLAGDERFVVMEQAELLPCDLFRRKQLADRVNARILAWKALDTSVDDTHPDNWGIHEGKIRLLDYQETP